MDVREKGFNLPAVRPSTVDEGFSPLTAVSTPSPCGYSESIVTVRIAVEGRH
jgi:hypothetical protein